MGKQSTIIRSVQEEQAQIIKDILMLHAEGEPIDVDCTYSKGNFYNNTGITRPKHCFDIKPQYKFVKKARAEKLPLPNECVRVIMFDPPFLSDAGYTKSPTGKIGKRFGTVGKDMHALWKWYEECLFEFERVLQPNGILIFKCQDTVSEGTQYFSHCAIMDYALQAGFYPKDLFVLVAKSRPIGKYQKQLHARKYHSYFWVFQKKYCKVEYPIFDT